MVTFCHPVFSPSSVLIFLLLVEEWMPAICQVGLRTLPLTSQQNKTSSLGLFSKWADGSSSHGSVNNPSIEMELAAILRDIAYGVSTEATTTTTTTTTTTEKPYKNVYDPEEIPPPSSIPVSPPWKDKSWKKEPPGKDGARPVQHQYVESPVIKPSEEKDFENFKETDSTVKEVDSAPDVISSGAGNPKAEWISSLGVMWEVHVYTTAGLFSLLVLLSLYCLARIHVATMLLPRGYYITVHLLVFLAAFFRCVYFFHDPYASASLLPSVLSDILYNTGIPCVITAFSVLILALLKSARLIILPLNLQSPIAVAIISIIIIGGSITVDTFGSLLKGQHILPGLKGVTLALTAGWGAALCIGYIFVFIRVEKAAQRQQNEIVRLTFSRLHTEGSSLPRKMPRSSLKFSARFTLIASIAGILLGGLQVYGLINSKIVVKLPPSQPWVWLVYQTCCRLLEIAMWTCISVASGLPANLAKDERDKGEIDDSQFLTAFSCNRCMTNCSNISSCCIFEKNAPDDMYSTICQSNHIARNFSIQHERKLIPQDTIASTGVPPKHISTTLLPPKTKKAKLSKTATLHSAGSDAHLLWNNNSNANSSNSSRPSSLILSEGGLIKFRTHDPHSETVRILNYPKKDYDPKTELNAARMKIIENYSNSGEDNYINSGALTPEEKRIIEKSIQSGKLPQLIGNDVIDGGYRSVQLSTPQRRINVCRETHSTAHEPYKYSGICSASSEGQFYDDSDAGFYQTPSLDSSLESSGHIYASIQQPIDRMRIMQQIRKMDVESIQGKILNNSTSPYHTSFQHRRPSSSNHSSNDIIQTDYLTDASQEHTDSPSIDQLSSYVESHNYPQQNDQFYSPRNGRSPAHGYHCYMSKQDNYSSSLTPTHENEFFHHSHNDDRYQNSESEDIDQGCPVSPSENKKFLNMASNSNFNNISYTPLQGEDDKHYSEDYRERIRPCGHRPRKLKLSPTSKDSSKQFTDYSNSDCHETEQSTCHNSKYDCNNAKEQWGDEEETRIYFSPSGRERQKQKLEELSRIEEQKLKQENSFQPLTAHKTLSDRVPWTDLRTSQKAPPESLGHETSTVKSNSEVISSQCIETNNDDPTEKSMEVRWPLKCKEETGV